MRKSQQPCSGAVLCVRRQRAAAVPWWRASHHITPCAEAATGTQVSLSSYQPPWSLVSAGSKTKPGYRSPPRAHGHRAVPSFFAPAVPTDFIWAGMEGGRPFLHSQITEAVIYILHATAAGLFLHLPCRLVTMRDPTIPWAPGVQTLRPGGPAESLIWYLKRCFLTAFISCINLVQKNTFRQQTNFLLPPLKPSNRLSSQAWRALPVFTQH